MTEKEEPMVQMGVIVKGAGLNHKEEAKLAETKGYTLVEQDDCIELYLPAKGIRK